MDMMSMEYARELLDFFCIEIGERPVGSQGNRSATDKFSQIVKSQGWDLKVSPFSALDWKAEGAQLSSSGQNYEVFPSPYSLGCEVYGILAAAGSLQELKSIDCGGLPLLLHSGLAREQLMPKNFPFYNPEEHQEVIRILEEKNPAVIISATGRNAALAGGVYPFPLIEDGDFQIPSVYMTEEQGRVLLQEEGKEVRIISKAARIPGTSCQLSASRGGDQGRIVISAHIDAKIGTPGAIDNATGVIVLLLLAGHLKNYQGPKRIELLPFNGEDYYGANGQKLYLAENKDSMDEIILNINIDGAGYHQGISSLSPFNLQPGIKEIVDEMLAGHPGISEGKPWYQGDHSIFLQRGVPAIAFSSQWFLDNLESQNITHTPRDNPGIVDYERVVEMAQFIADLVRGIK